MIEPVIITFNRAESLARTLVAFRDAGWGERVFHVLDNASTDATRETIEAFQQEWPGLCYHRNRWNIGGNANILRAVELSDCEYHWVIGDDDAWTFAAADELDRVLSEGQADIIRLGWLVEEPSRGKYIALSDLARRERMFFASVSMVSATIIRRSLLTRVLPESYHNIGNFFPQLVAVMRAIETGATVYSLSRDYMMHTPGLVPGYFLGDLEIYAGWYATSRYLSDDALRARFLGEFIRCKNIDRGGVCKEVTWLAKVALNGKGQGVPQGQYLCSMLGNSRGDRLPILLAIFVYMLVPGVFARLLRKIYRKIKGLPVNSTSQVDRSRL